MTVSLVSDRGLLRIDPPVEELKGVLQFRHKFTQETERQVMTAAGMITIKNRGRIIGRVEPLYSTGPDGALYTHDGMLHAVCDTLTSLGKQYTYERLDPQWPVPIINAATFKGLYPEQKLSVVKMLSSTGGAMMQGTTGLGKTHCIMALVRAYRNYRIVIATKAASVARGLRKSLSSMLNPEGIQIGIAQGKNVKMEQITVCTNAMLRHFDPEEVDVLIMDEVHSAAGNATSASILAFSKAVKYGLSATIKKRFDGKDKYLESLFGPIVSDVTDQQAEELKRVCPINAYFLSVPSGPPVDSCSEVTRERRGIWNNPVRNKLIRDVADRVPPNQQLLIFVRTIKHLDVLMKDFLPEFEFCHADMPPAERLKIEERFTSGDCKRLIATDCLSTGVDPKNLMVVIDASGVKGDAAMVQKRGRLRRWAPGKTFGVLINFCDEWSDKLGRKAQARIAECEDRGDTIYEMAAPADIQFVDLEAVANQSSQEAPPAENIAPLENGQTDLSCPNLPDETNE